MYNELGVETLSLAVDMGPFYSMADLPQCRRDHEISGDSDESGTPRGAAHLCSKLCSDRVGKQRSGTRQNRIGIRRLSAGNSAFRRDPKTAVRALVGLANRLTRLSGSLRFGASSWSGFHLGTIWATIRFGRGADESNALSEAMRSGRLEGPRGLPHGRPRAESAGVRVECPSERNVLASRRGPSLKPPPSARLTAPHPSNAQTSFAVGAGVSGTPRPRRSASGRDSTPVCSSQRCGPFRGSSARFHSALLTLAPFGSPGAAGFRRAGDAPGRPAGTIRPTLSQLFLAAFSGLQLLECATS